MFYRLAQHRDAKLRHRPGRTHAFPPAFTMLAEWHPELETLAVELDFPIKSSAEIEKCFRGIIRELGRDCGRMREKSPQSFESA